MTVMNWAYWQYTPGYATRRYINEDGRYIILYRINGTAEQNGWQALYKANPHQPGAQRLAAALATFDDAEQAVMAHIDEVGDF